MKVILDTNVFISGVYFGGHPYRILQAWNSGRLVLIVSKEILDEYGRRGGASLNISIAFQPEVLLLRDLAASAHRIADCRRGHARKPGEIRHGRPEFM